MKLRIVLAVAATALAQERLVLEDLARAPGGRGGAALSPDGKRFATVDNGQIAAQRRWRLRPLGVPRRLSLGHASATERRASGRKLSLRGI